MRRKRGSSPPKNDPSIKFHDSDLPLEKVERIAKLCDIPEKLVPEVRKRLGVALMNYSLYQTAPRKLTHKQTLRGLESLLKKAQALITELEREPQILEAVAYSYEMGVSDDYHGDPKILAQARLRKTYEAVKGLSKETENALKLRQDGPPQRVIINWKGEATPLEEPDILIGGNSDPPMGLLVCAIFDAWENILKREAKITKASPFCAFADQVFELIGEKALPFDTIKSRLENPRYARLWGNTRRHSRKLSPQTG